MVEDYLIARTLCAKNQAKQHSAERFLLLRLARELLELIGLRSRGALEHLRRRSFPFGGRGKKLGLAVLRSWLRACLPEPAGCLDFFSEGLRLGVSAALVRRGRSLRLRKYGK